MADSYPFIVYFEGTPQAGDTIYSYTCEFPLTLNGYRILSRDGGSLQLGLRRNGTLLDLIEGDGTEFQDLDIPEINFAIGDVLSITVPVSATLTALTVVFFVTIEGPADTSGSLASNQIQTPLVARFEGELDLNDTFFYNIPNQRIEIFRYTVSLRNPANSDVILDLQKDGITVTQIVLPTGQLFGEGLIDVYFEAGQTITFEVTGCGNDPEPGESLLLLLDYRNVNQAVFSSFQSPFVIEYEGLDLPESNTIIRYKVPRNITVANLQLFLREPIIDDLQVGLYKNGEIITTFSLLAGQMSTPPTVVNLPYATDDYFEAIVIQPQSLSSGLILTVDYFIPVETFIEDVKYYSDPQVDIVLLARQIGFGGAKADAISFENLEKYQKDVDNILNSRLRCYYRTPLRRVGAPPNPWPGAIQLIAQRMVLRYLINDVFSDVEPNTSANADKQEALAREDLDLILTRQHLLEGQPLRSKNWGSNPYTEPLTVISPNPPVPPSTP